MTEKLSITDIIKLKELQDLQNRFCAATGVASLITTPEGVPITEPTNFCRLCNDIIRKTEIGNRNCCNSNVMSGPDIKEKVLVYKCTSAGLWKAGASISVQGQHIANWLIGQVKNDEIDEEQVLNYAATIGVDKKMFVEAWEEVPVMSLEQFEKIANLMYLSANEISKRAFRIHQLQEASSLQKKTEDKLKNSELKYRLLFELNQAGIYKSTLDGRLLECNQKFADILGYKSIDDIINIPATELYFTVENREEFLNNLKLTGSFVNSEILMKSKSGKLVWILENVKLIENEKNSDFTILGTCIDITGKKEIEKALIENETRYRMLVENAFDGIYLCRNRKFDYVNTRFSEITGYTFKEATDPNFDLGIMLTKNSRNLVKKPYLAQQSGEKIPGQYEIEIISKDGSLKHVSVSTASMSAENEVMVTGILHDITHRKQTEHLLQQSEKTFREMLNSVTDAIFILNIKGEFIEMNKTAEELYSSSKKELIGKTPKIFAAPEKNDWDKVQQKIEEAYHGKPGTLEFYGIKKDGSYSIRDVSLTPVDYFGQKAVIAISRDITDRKKTEEALKESEERYRTFINSTDDLVYIKDDKLKYIVVNQKNIDFFGKPANLILGKTDFDLMPAENAKNCQESDLKAIRDNKIVVSVETIGSRVYESRKFPLKINKEKTGVGAFIRDITEQTTARKKLEANEQFQTLLNQMTAMALDTHDSEELFKVLSVQISRLFNADACYITLWDEKEKKAIPFTTSIMPNEKYRSMPQYEENITLTDSVLKAGHPLIIDDVFNSPYLSRRIAERFPTKSVMALPLEASNKKLGAILIAFNSHHIFTDEDVSRGKIAAHQISLIVDKIKVMDELKENQEHLKKLNNEKDKFFSIMAHDIKSPFSAFLGLTEIMSEDFDQFTLKEIQSFIVTMHKSASSLYRLLENLLEWASFQRGIIEFNPQLLSLTRIVNYSFELIQNAAVKKDIEINHQIPEDFEIYGDLHMLDTILRNLTSNAVKFTPKGGTITISAHKDENDNTIITVSDTGIGMSEEMIGNLFKVDVNISRTGTEGEPSTGLGLILCKEFIEKHGGKIWVESESGIGSSFNLYLPSKPKTIEPNTHLS